MSNAPATPFGAADFFGVLSEGGPAADAGDRDDSPLIATQYGALLAMLAGRLGIAAGEAERLFTCHRDGADAPAPLLCAHLAREGAGPYLAARPSASTIPDVRCCDARDVDKRDPFPAGARGPHVHCLRCFQHTVVCAPAPALRGVPPPVVADYRDAASLQAHLVEHRLRYVTLLGALDEFSSRALDDAEADAGVEECEAAAEEAGRHVCVMAALGTAACATVVFYCAECDAFAPLTRFSPIGTGSGSDVLHADEASWVAVDSANVVLSRLLLGLHVLYMLDPERFRSSGGGAHRRRHRPVLSPAHATRHLLFLYKALLFDMETEEAAIDAFEAGAVCTHAAVVLPNAGVAGTPPLLLLREDAGGDSAAGDAGPQHEEGGRVAPSHFSPVVLGFGMEWATVAEVQERVAMVTAAHTRAAVEEGGEPSSSSPAPPAAVARFSATTRLVYILDTEEWAVAHVLYHRVVASAEELPHTYVDEADDGIRVLAEYDVATPMPRLAAASDSCSSSETSVEENADGGDDDTTMMDGCPYSMESRTIDFFVRMTALAKAMHELAAWRLTVDENKAMPPPEP